MNRPSHAVLVGMLLLSLPAAVSAVAPPPPRPTWDPDERYTVQSLRGWTLKVHRCLFDAENEALRRDTLELLDSHLYQIARAIPAGPLAKLRQVPIWIELAHPRHPCMCYHVSKAWLREHHMNPNKAGGVELANCRNFLAWTRTQPAMVLHELAHAYHHQVLGFDHPGIRLCHEQAMRDKLYDSVLHIDGSRRKHYACTNPTEYFAEMTEAYFGTNDFYPFVRAELRGHDPRMCELIERVWEVRRPRRDRAATKR